MPGALPRRPGKPIVRTPILAPKSKQPTTAKRPPQIKRANNIVTTSRIAGGVDNPYGAGASAFEPNTEVYEAKFDAGSDNPLLKGYSDAYNSVQDSRAKESQAQQAAEVQEFTYAPDAAVIGGGSGKLLNAPGSGTGSVANIINAAKTMLGKPYVWGGTTSRGVDCSGLIYFAFRQAGINIPRYRAVDYGKSIGKAVTAESARAGDLVYWDNPGDVDHVGIYLGDGMVIQSPQTGDVTKISKVWGNAQFRRVLTDDAFGQVATPTGRTVTSYAGQPAAPQFVNTNNRRVSVAGPGSTPFKGGSIRAS